MQVYILDETYNVLGVIDEAESVLWNKKYNDIGESEIYIPCSSEYLELIKAGSYLFRYDDDMVCKIEKREIETDIENGDFLIVRATDLCKILSGRIVRWQIVYSGAVTVFIRKILESNVIYPEQSNRRIPYDTTNVAGFDFVVDTSNGETLAEKISVSTFTDDLLQLIITTCKTYNYGFRLTFDINTRKLVFRLYKGKNKALPTGDEYVEFSPRYSNIISSHYIEDKSNLKNVAYVSYKAADESVQLLSVYRGMGNGVQEPRGEERHEIYVDGTGTSRDITYAELKQMFPTAQKSTSTNEEGKVTATYTYAGNVVATSEGEGEDEKIVVSDYTYLLLIRALGDNALAERTDTTEFSGTVDTIDTYEYKTDYNIGDIVKVINEHGIEAEARITEIMESDDNEDGYVAEPTFEYLN